MNSSDQASNALVPTEASSGGSQPDESSFDWKTTIETNAEQIHPKISQLRYEHGLQDRRIRALTFSLSMPEETQDAEGPIFTELLQFPDQTEVYVTVEFEPELVLDAGPARVLRGGLRPGEFPFWDELAALCCVGPGPGPAPGPGPRGDRCYCRPCYEA